jgi:nitroimidazol reductase NimA-like FMN-containing flavoprotein (pyridoxamine 5'-phosphate oxidase superfamily)
VPLTPEEVDAFLAELHLCHFGTVDADGNPRVRPLWYLWKDGAFWLTTRLEARHTGRDLASSPHVAISVASGPRAVMAFGHIEVLGKDEEVLRAIAVRYGEEEGLRFLQHAMEQPDRVAMRMQPETVLSWDNSREGTDEGSKRTVL